MSGRSQQARGAWGEARAARHYESLGYTILARGWRPSGVGVRGELDLIARRASEIVVCEVKARRAGAPGVAAQAVTPDKQQRIRQLAALWLDATQPGDVEIRFDVVAFDGTEMTHYQAAF